MPNSASFYSAESLSLIGALTAAVLTLWRALQAKDKQLQKLIAETVHQSDLIDSLAQALDRIRSEGCANSPTPSARPSPPAPKK